MHRQDRPDFDSIALFLVCCYAFEGHRSAEFQRALHEATESRSIDTVRAIQGGFARLLELCCQLGTLNPEIGRDDIEETCRLYEEIVVARFVTGV